MGINSIQTPSLQPPMQQCITFIYTDQGSRSPAAYRLMNLPRLNAAEQTYAHTNEPLAGLLSFQLFTWFSPLPPPRYAQVERPPGRGFRVLRRHDWQMNLKPLIKSKSTWLRDSLTSLQSARFGRPPWRECLIAAELFYVELSRAWLSLLKIGSIIVM